MELALLDGEVDAVLGLVVARASDRVGVPCAPTASAMMSANAPIRIRMVRRRIMKKDSPVYSVQTNVWESE